ncbi:uncharacterized protein LOC134205101 [Armigeres subalbatus]|uniref:uncharacterized protein LOC134205101 n=1 Tax=Armigeres subalbatus TaxID=124917 RepID=UPI002ED0A846
MDIHLPLERSKANESPPTSAVVQYAAAAAWAYRLQQVLSGTLSQRSLPASAVAAAPNHIPFRIALVVVVVVVYACPSVRCPPVPHQRVEDDDDDDDEDDGGQQACSLLASQSSRAEMCAKNVVIVDYGSI